MAKVIARATFIQTVKPGKNATRDTPAVEPETKTIRSGEEVEIDDLDLDRMLREGIVELPPDVREASEAESDPQASGGANGKRGKAAG